MAFSIYNLLEFKFCHSSSFVILSKFKCNMSFLCSKSINVSVLCLILICPACSFIRLVLGSVLYRNNCYFFCIVMSFTIFLCCLIYMAIKWWLKKNSNLYIWLIGSIPLTIYKVTYMYLQWVIIRLMSKDIIYYQDLSLVVWRIAKHNTKTYENR